jgi:hypothetical protein
MSLSSGINAASHDIAERQINQPGQPLARSTEMPLNRENGTASCHPPVDDQADRVMPNRQTAMELTGGPAFPLDAGPPMSVTLLISLTSEFSAKKSMFVRVQVNGPHLLASRVP